MMPKEGTYPAYYHKYFLLVKDEELLPALENNLTDFKQFFESISAEKENYAYAPGKWTIKELINHITDTERIFAYRALRFARKDPQLLPAYEEDDYARASAAEVNARSIKSLIEEFEQVRRSTISMYTNFSDESLNLSGKLPAGEISVLTIGYVLCGHVIHHIKVVKEKYL